MIYTLTSLAMGGQIDERGVMWLVGAIFALPTILFCLVQIKKLRSPDARDLYRTKTECDKLCSANLEQHEKIGHEFNERMASMSGHSAQSRKEMYITLKGLAENVSALKATDEIQTQRLFSLEQKIDRIWEKIK